MRRILTVLVLFHNFLNGHGFGGSTYVTLATRHLQQIEQIVECSETQSIMSYHCESQQCHSHKILARAGSTTNCYYTINLDNNPSPDITCSPLQQFYPPEKHCWVPAHALQVGDVLLTERQGNLPIVRITFVQQQLDLYALKIECPHTFFVGRHSVLTHNMNLPVASVCWELPLTISTLSAAGGLCTGFAMAASGFAAGAIAASLIYSAVMDHKAKKYHEVQIPKDNMTLYHQKALEQNIISRSVKEKEAKLPRKGSYPFIPKKTKDGRIPRDRDGGFIDRRGRSWIWDPKKEEWDVQVDGGRRHINVNTSGEETH